MSHEKILEKTQELIGIAEQFNQLGNKNTRNALKICLENFIQPLAWVVQPHLQMVGPLTHMEGYPVPDDDFENIDRDGASLKDLYDSCENLLASLRDALERSSSPTSVTRSASDVLTDQDIQSEIQHHLEAVIEKASTLLEPEVEEVEEDEEDEEAPQPLLVLQGGIFNNPPQHPQDGSYNGSDGGFFPFEI
jgi:hypothetical protein